LVRIDMLTVEEAIATSGVEIGAHVDRQAVRRS
jgi:hypothetical protein